MDKHSSILLAVGGVIAAAGGAFMAVPPRRGTAPGWANAWFDAGFACVIAGLLLAGLGLLAHFRRMRQTPPTPEAKGTQRDLTAGAQSPPLVVKIMPHSWFDNWESCRIAILLVELENTTDRHISIARHEVTHEKNGRPHWDHQATNDQRMKIIQEITRRQSDRRYGMPLDNVRVIPARSCVSACFLAPVFRSAAGGSPEFILTVEDDIGNKYIARLPRREPRTYGPT
jgi:hypothetical protein